MADTNAHCIEVCAEVRYWEDARVNGVDDKDGTLIPFRIGNLWKPLIRLADGYIIGWPEGTTASIHYKVCDQGEYWLTDELQERIAKWKGNYVPDEFLCVGDNGYGDYIIFKVGADGKIAGWTLPDIVDKEWVLLPVGNDDLAQVMKAHPTRVTAAGVALLQQEVERLKATPPADAALAEYCERAARNWTKGCDMYIGLMCAAAALRARPQAVAEGKQYHDVAQRLYELLDNIDTASDVAKSDDKLYRGIVERTQAKKRDYIVSCDGYTVVLADDSMLAASQSATGGAE